MDAHEIETGLYEAAERWTNSPVRQRSCTVLARQPTLVAESVSPETLAEIPWPWKVSFPLNAAIHLLVLDGSAPELAAYLPSVGGTRPLDAGFDAALLTLIASEADRLRELSRRPLRTQDPRQTLALHQVLQASSDLLPGDQDWSLLSLGCAAGFELLVGDADFCGEQICYPVPRERTGADLDPIDPADDDALRWLLACSDAGTAAVAPLVERAVSRLGSVEHTILQDDAASVLSALPAGPDVLAVSHQFLCSVDDPAGFADTISRSPRVTRWLSVEVPSTARLAYEVIDDHPPGTSLATLLDGDLQVLHQGPVPTPG